MSCQIVCRDTCNMLRYKVGWADLCPSSVRTLYCRVVMNSSNNLIFEYLKLNCTICFLVFGPFEISEQYSVTFIFQIYVHEFVLFGIQIVN